MRRRRVRVIGSLAIASIVLTGCSIRGNGLAWLSGSVLSAQTVAEQQADLAGDIVFSTPSGTFQGQVSVGLSTSIANAEIRYTTNGTLPTTSSTLYQGTPLVLTSTKQVRAQAVVAGSASARRERRSTWHAQSTPLTICRWW